MNDFESEQPNIDQRAKVSGVGHNIRDINQIASQHIYNGPYYAGTPEASDLPAAEIETKWSWKSPLTQARLAWLGLFFSIIPLASIYQLVKHAVDGSAFALSSDKSSVPIIWIVGLLVGMTILLAIATMWRVVHLRIHALSNHSMLPAATEIDGRFAIARLRGKCPLCDAKLRFYNKPVRWTDYTDEHGKMKRKVAEREMAAECCRYAKHWWAIDPTLELEFDS